MYLLNYNIFIYLLNYNIFIYLLNLSLYLKKYSSKILENIIHVLIS